MINRPSQNEKVFYFPLPALAFSFNKAIVSHAILHTLTPISFRVCALALMAVNKSVSYEKEQQNKRRHHDHADMAGRFRGHFPDHEIECIVTNDFTLK
jgi:hypothetical protein